MRVANCLEHLGIKNGDVIGLVSENRLEFPCVAFAAYYLGATLAPINLTYTDRKLESNIWFQDCRRHANQLNNKYSFVSITLQKKIESW